MHSKGQLDPLASFHGAVLLLHLRIVECSLTHPAYMCLHPGIAGWRLGDGCYSPFTKSSRGTIVAHSPVIAISISR